MSQLSSASSLTAQQARAVLTRDVSIVLSSGAGCGKTHVLTERYLAHLREGAEVGEVVAITFTERAARQMRGRIRQAVIGHLMNAADDESAEVWARHLRALENAPISTIHAFCGNLLRQYAVEAGLDPAFDILEEVLAANLRTTALNECLQRLLVVETPVAEDLRELVLLYGWRVVGSTVASLMNGYDDTAWRTWMGLSDEAVAREWLREARESVLPRHLAQWLRTRPAVARCLELLRRYPPLPGPMTEPVLNILRETPRLPQAEDLPGTIEQLANWAKVGRVGVKAWPDAGVYAEIKEAFENFRDALRGLQPERFSASTEELVDGVVVGKRFLRVTSAAVAAYRDRKRAHGVVDFNDLLATAGEVLRRPEVRARLQDRYRHVLVDELQDTDPVQMDVVEALTGGGLTGGKMFAVGDHKQSIYRFRGADVSLFRTLSGRMPHEGRQSLSVNFRSQPAILDFVNALCAEAVEDYEPLVPYQTQQNAGACIEFLWTLRPEESNATEARAVEAEAIAQRIASMVNTERLVVDEQTQQLRAVRPGDVVLLFRAMSNVHLYEAALRRAGLHYYLVGGRAFFAQQEIYDLYHLLMALENPQDDLSLAGALRSPYFCLSDEALFALSRHRKGLWSALGDEYAQTLLPEDQIDRVRRARLLLREWRELKDRLPIAGLVNRILADTGYDAALQMEFLGQRKLANLWKLVDLARTFDRSGLFGLAEFTARLGDLVAAQPREEQAATQPENADVVRLMTIHQAKGLEFPVVFVPDFGALGGPAYWPAACWDRHLGCVARPPADEEEPPFAPFAWSVRQASEELQEWAEDVRTLYVACTRPRDYLVLSAALPIDYRPAGAWMQTLGSRFDLATGTCLVPGVVSPRIRVAQPGEVFVAPRVETPEVPKVIPASPPILEYRRGTATVRAEDLRRLASGGVGLFAQDTAADAVAGVLRRVLERWDFRDLHKGLSLVERFATTGGVREEVNVALERLTTSAPGERLAKAKRLRRRVEYAWMAEREAVPGLMGVLDLLYEDEAGWHIVEWVTERVYTAGQTEEARQRFMPLVLAAQTLHPAAKTVWVVFAREGVAVEKSVGKSGSSTAAEVVRLLAGIAEREVSART